MVLEFRIDCFYDPPFPLALKYLQVNVPPALKCRFYAVGVQQLGSTQGLPFAFAWLVHHTTA